MSFPAEVTAASSSSCCSLLNLQEFVQAFHYFKIWESDHLESCYKTMKLPWLNTVLYDTTSGFVGSGVLLTWCFVHPAKPRGEQGRCEALLSSTRHMGNGDRYSWLAEMLR